MNTLTESLTERQTQIIKYASEGYTIRETAELMKLRPNTIQHYLETIRLKIGAANTTHAVTIALRNGWIL